MTAPTAPCPHGFPEPGWDCCRPDPDVPLLACGHPDTDPTVYHNGPDQQPVCAACCPECGDTA